MNLKELCEQRYSVRAYLPQAIEKEKIDYMLQCAQLAPSAANRQPWVYYVVTDKTTQQEIHQSYNRPWFAKASLYIVVCKNTAESWKRPDSDGKDYSDVDAAITASHLYLAAHELGLGICWVCNFNPPILRQALKIEDENTEPIVVFSIGYIDQENSKIPNKTRKDLAETVRWI